MKECIQTDAAPDAVGPYSQAVRTGNLLFVSGQLPLEPRNGEPVGGDIRTQTRRVMSNVQAVVEAAGASLSDVVKTSCFLADMGDFAAFNKAYGEFFPADPPAREAIEAAALPKGAAVEVSVICELDR